MTLPGATVTIRDSPPPRSAPTDTGVWFAAGLADKGVTTEATLITSLASFVAKFGPRVSYSVLYDCVETFFREGGGKMYVARVVGPAPVTATKTLNDAGAAAALRVDALGPGDWGNSLNVTVTAGGVGGTFVLTITHDTDTTISEISPDLADLDAAVAWGLNSDYVRVVKLGTLDPAVVAVQSLTLGADDRSNIVDAQWQTALDRFIGELGPGQVSQPGRTTTAAHTQLVNHGEAYNRVALLDGADTTTVATLTALVASMRTLGDPSRYGALFAPWVKIPGLTAGTTRTVPPSPLVAGLIARSDGKGNSPNVPAAGDNGQAQYAVDLTQAGWTDAQRETLNDGGVDVLRVIYGGVRLYGYRTLANPASDPAWVSLGNIRLFTGIVAKGGVIAERYVLSELDGRRVKISQYGGDLIGMLIPYFDAGSLYGDTPEDAFHVEVGEQVNTDETIGNGELRAVISLRMSPFAEMVNLELVKVPITEAVA